ncbi:MAG: hypothetical protein ACLQU1_24605 [Bryobacteraceae bacterium]
MLEGFCTPRPDPMYAASGRHTGNFQWHPGAPVEPEPNWTTLTGVSSSVVLYVQ